MKVIYPERFKDRPIAELLRLKEIIEVKNNPTYRNTIFPKSTKIRKPSNFYKNRIITQIDDSFFNNFYVLDTMNQIIYTDDNTKRHYIKSAEFGDIENSYKRYNNVNSPIDYNVDADKFLNLNKYRKQVITEHNIKSKVILNPDKQTEIFTNDINILPGRIKSVDNFKRFNDRTTIEYVIKWARNEGIKYIYAIVENRPYVLSKEYTLPFTYFTVIGCKDK